MPAVAPDIKLVASNTHGHGLGTFRRTSSTSFASGTILDRPKSVSPSPRRSNNSDSSSSEDEPAEFVHVDAFSRAPSIYKGAQW